MKPKAPAGPFDGAKRFVDIVGFVGEKTYKHTVQHFRVTLLAIEDLCKFDKLNAFCTVQETRHEIDCQWSTDNQDAEDFKKIKKTMHAKLHKKRQ